MEHKDTTRLCIINIYFVNFNKKYLFSLFRRRKFLQILLNCRGFELFKVISNRIQKVAFHSLNVNIITFDHDKKCKFKKVWNRKIIIKTVDVTHTQRIQYTYTHVEKAHLAKSQCLRANNKKKFTYAILILYLQVPKMNSNEEFGCAFRPLYLHYFWILLKIDFWSATIPFGSMLNPYSSTVRLSIGFPIKYLVLGNLILDNKLDLIYYNWLRKNSRTTDGMTHTSMHMRV